MKFKRFLLSLFKTIKYINFTPILKNRQAASLHYYCTPHNFHSLLTFFSKSHGPCEQRSLTKILPEPCLNLLSPNNYCSQNSTLSQGHVGSGTTFGGSWLPSWQSRARCGGDNQRLSSGGYGALDTRRHPWCPARARPLRARQPLWRVWESWDNTITLSKGRG